MKAWALRFFLSRAGGIITPIVATIVSAAVVRVADFDATLAGSIDQAAVVAFLVAAIMSLINAWTNAANVPRIKRIQALVNVPQDGYAGPVTWTEVRRAVVANDPDK
jgi:hypothetical protein